jgi:hypothetical protein
MTAGVAPPGVVRTVGRPPAAICAVQTAGLLAEPPQAVQEGAAWRLRLRGATPVTAVVQLGGADGRGLVVARLPARLPAEAREAFAAAAARSLAGAVREVSFRVESAGLRATASLEAGELESWIRRLGVLAEGLQALEDPGLRATYLRLFQAHTLREGDGER